MVRSLRFHDEVPYGSEVYRPRGGAEELMEATDDLVLIEGPAGTGKTLACCWKAHLLCQIFKGARILFCRKTRKSLSQSVLVTFERDVLRDPDHPAKHGKAGRSHRESYIYPETGSEIVLGGLDDPENTFSMEYDVVFVFEAKQVAQESVELLIRVNRNYAMPYQQIICDTNPGPRFHWLNRWARDGVMRRILSRHKDNPMLWDDARGDWTQRGRDYVGRKLERMTGSRRRRLLLGEWSEDEGLIYDRYEERIHVIDGALEKHPSGFGWVIVAPECRPIEVAWFMATQDWGNYSPGCLQLWAMTKDGASVLVREVYKREPDPSWWSGQLAKMVEEIGYEWLHVVVCDNDEGRIISHNRRLAQMGGAAIAIPTQKGPNSVAEGISEVSELLRCDPSRERPGVMFLRDALRDVDRGLLAEGKPISTLEEITAYSWHVDSQGRTLDKPDPYAADHGMDAMRYMALYRRWKDLSPLGPQEEAYGPRSVGALMAELEKPRPFEANNGYW